MLPAAQDRISEAKVPVMGKTVFLKIVFYFKIQNTILFSICILLNYFQNSFKNYFGQRQNSFSK